MDKKFHGIATCPEETKSLLVQELKSLGAQDIEESFRAVTFSCSEKQLYAFHLQLRTASRILTVIKDIPAASASMLANQLRRIPWDQWIDPQQTFLVEGIQTHRGDGFLGSNAISKHVRTALQDSLQKRTGSYPQVNLKEPDITFVAFYQKNRLVLSVDTSKKALHKRGYKNDRHPAPLKETLAAALLMFMHYDGSQVLFDPMCGSGTIPIEAAMLALRKAPLIHRKKGEFGFEDLPFFNKELYRDVQDELRQERVAGLKAPIFAGDIRRDYIDAARDNALRARVEKHISFEVGDFFLRKPPAEKGFLVMNLPYGERLEKDSDKSAFKLFYEKLGDYLKKNYQGWKIGVLALENSPFQHIGLKPSKKVSLLNGSLEVKFLVFEIFAGSRKDFVTKNAKDVKTSKEPPAQTPAKNFRSSSHRRS